MIFFSPVPMQFAPASLGTPAPTPTLVPSGKHGGGKRAPLRSIVERCIDVWTAAYSSGLAPSL